MQIALKLLGLALLEILAWLLFFSAANLLLAMFGQDDEYRLLAGLTIIPIALLGCLLAHFWGLWRANWMVRAATAATCLLVPIVPFYLLLIGLSAL